MYLLRKYAIERHNPGRKPGTRYFPMFPVVIGMDKTTVGLRHLAGEKTRHTIAVVLLSLVVVTAGCSGVIGGADDTTDDSPPLDDIPADADGIVHLKSGVLTDSTTETLMNGLLETDAASNTNTEMEPPENWEEVLNELESESDVAVDDVYSATMFVGGEPSAEGEQYAGFILKTDLNWEDLQSAIEDESVETDTREESYNGVTVYVQEANLDGVEDTEIGDQAEMDNVETWVADFGDGRFAFGTEQVVKDVIDTRQGDGEGIDEELRTTFEGTTEGYMTAAFTLTDQQSSMASDIASEEAGVGSMFIPEADAVTMSYHTENGQMNMETDLVLQSSEDASTFTSFVQPFVSPPDAPENPSPGDQPIDWLIDSVTINAEDERVSMSFNVGPEKLVDALEALSSESALGDKNAFQTDPGLAAD